MTFLDSKDPTPRYLRLATLYRQRIQKGVWQSDTHLPTIEQLMQEFQVARVTVRQALSLLINEGLLRSGRGKGIEVIGKIDRPKFLKLETSLAEMAAVYKNDKPSLTLIDEKEKSPVYLHPEDGIAANEYRHLRRVHTRDHKPYCVISIYLSEEVFQMAPEQFRKETVIPVLMDLKKVAIKSAKQSLKISSADIEIASLLKISVNSPVAEVRRVIKDKINAVLYLGEITYRADFINFEMDLKTK